MYNLGVLGEVMYSLLVVQSTIYGISSIAYIAKCTVHKKNSAHCGVKSSHCGVKSAHCRVKSAHCGVKNGVKSGVQSAHCEVKSAQVWREDDQ